MLQVQSFVLLVSNVAPPPGLRQGHMVSEGNLLDCARLCLHQHNCSSFFYDDINNSCTTSRRTLTSKQLNISREGVTYYSAKSPAKSTKRKKKSETGHKEDCNKYKLVEEEKSWFDAKDHCEKSGGRLAQVHTKEGIMALKGIYFRQKFPTNGRTKHNGYWMGGREIRGKETQTNDKGNETIVKGNETKGKEIETKGNGNETKRKSGWIWTDGSTVPATGWMKGAPDSRSNKSQCVCQYPLGWEDSTCIFKMYFLCQSCN